MPYILPTRPAVRAVEAKAAPRYARAHGIQGRFAKHAPQESTAPCGSRPLRIPRSSGLPRLKPKDSVVEILLGVQESCFGPNRTAIAGDHCQQSLSLQGISARFRQFR